MPDLDIDVSKFEQYIYNNFLMSARTANNLPYKLRKDFSKMKDIDINNLKKLSIFFNKFKHIKIEEFFNAPYKVYSDEKYFDLDYYTTLKATKAYMLYQQKLLMMSPDSQEQLENIQQSLRFISNFCKDNNISVDEYINHKTNNMFSFLLHLKEHRINVYCLFGFILFEKAFKSVDSEILAFILGEDLVNNIPTLRTKYFNSIKARKFIELGINKITK